MVAVQEGVGVLRCISGGLGVAFVGPAMPQIVPIGLWWVSGPTQVLVCAAAPDTLHKLLPIWARTALLHCRATARIASSPTVAVSWCSSRDPTSIPYSTSRRRSRWVGGCLLPSFLSISY
jgi:hypothetical protein